MALILMVLMLGNLITGKTWFALISLNQHPTANRMTCKTEAQTEGCRIVLNRTGKNGKNKLWLSYTNISMRQLGLDSFYFVVVHTDLGNGLNKLVEFSDGGGA